MERAESTCFCNVGAVWVQIKEVFDHIDILNVQTAPMNWQEHYSNSTMINGVRIPFNKQQVVCKIQLIGKPQHDGVVLNQVDSPLFAQNHLLHWLHTLDLLPV